MAGSEETSQASRLTLNAYQTALCVVPPLSVVQDANRLRALYDQAYEKWPAHVNLIYPFVSVDRLTTAVNLIRPKLASWLSEIGVNAIHLRLDKPACFPQRNGNIIHLGLDDDEGSLKFTELRSTIMEVLRLPSNEQNREYHPHLTIGYSKPNDDNARDYLLAKVKLLPPIEWKVGQLSIMVREKTADSCKMRLWGTIDLDGDASFNRIIATHDNMQGRELAINLDLSLQGLPLTPLRGSSGRPPVAESRATYRFSDDVGIWAPAELSNLPEDKEQLPGTLIVSSYNVLVDSKHPPATDRYPALLNTLISNNSVADVLLLQEVSDSFLAYLLGNERIRNIYPFATHGPPGQVGIGPLPSLRNIVALSRSNFSWSWLPFDTHHKGAVILKLDRIGTMEESGFVPTIIAGVHLSSGLSDHTVTMRERQLQKLRDLLLVNYTSNPKVVAGDFNMTTSAVTHEEAVEAEAISTGTAATLPVLESFFLSAGFLDSWFVAHTTMGDKMLPSRLERDFTQLYDGEQGATFDPLENPLAAISSISSANPRPHRYDRVLYQEDKLRVIQFNMFGFPVKSLNEANGNTELQFPSDHWGIRATLKFRVYSEEEDETPARPSWFEFIDVQTTHPDFHDPADLILCLADRSIFPSPEDAEKRKAAFKYLKHLIQHGLLPESGETHETGRSNFSFIVTAVGSYGLGVWTNSSDVDCLCVGPVSSTTFFELAMQKLRKGADSGVKILRKVKAATGTMWELEVNGVKFDLQYCPAGAVAERWLEVSHLPRADPLFDLAYLSLVKLQPYRDQTYLQRTIKNPAMFRLLHRVIKAWAKSRGIYSSRFGYLGGIHITLMLSRLLKLLPPNTTSVADILRTFFNHYADFYWMEGMVYDMNFHRKQPRYNRSPRECMVILTLHYPIMNVARTASISSMRTIVDEMNRADTLISEGRLRWTSLVGIAPQAGQPTLYNSADEFLKSYNRYIKINVQYWGLSLAKGSSLIGWLESRCLLLLADIHRKLPDLQTRIWPARFTQNEDNNKNTPTQEEREYQGCYLIGLAKADERADPANAASKPDRKLAWDTLKASLDQFASLIRNDKKYFDSTFAWVDVSHVKQADLGPLELDSRDWGDYTIQDGDFDENSDSEVDELDLHLDEDDGATAETQLLLSTSRRNIHKSGVAANKPVSTAKLRPASDILNRLRWDPSHDSSEYVIGYEDRFLGAKEIPLDRWKTEQTDEEFIPLHRILYFKRKGDGKVVWDREARSDDIFGSGVGSNI
ncbi:hypothetical protein ACO22_05312 [Paracoccidioides brasiliensis]|uniref:polynucleotide adenylyltransferase n=1 Tax=Paracoccidioides brasiliensis TaxID=121759 RepID=A0A1D2JAS5_PARBR|nr:hypothetical protein ACO22_05312 [Paracoccidioides brasiliensis]